MSNHGCSHPLSGICQLLTMVGDFLYLRDWAGVGPDTALLPANVPIVYKKAIEDTRRDDALPMVAYGTGEMSINRFMPMVGAMQIGGVGAVSGRVSTSVTFTVSTTNDSLSSSLAYALAAYCFTLTESESVSGLELNSVSVSTVTKNTAGFYEATVTVSCNTPAISWKFNDLGGKLREVQIDASIE